MFEDFQKFRTKTTFLWRMKILRKKWPPWMIKPKISFYVYLHFFPPMVILMISNFYTWKLSKSLASNNRLIDFFTFVKNNFAITITFYKSIHLNIHGCNEEKFSVFDICNYWSVQYIQHNKCTTMFLYFQMSNRNKCASKNINIAADSWNHRTMCVSTTQ